MNNNLFSSLTLNDGCRAKASIFPYGAHLSSWKTSKGKEWIFLSKQAMFKQGSAIRGGVPIIFPQFNAFGEGARHGFARNMGWRLSHSAECECCFELTETDKTLTDWPYPFKAEFRVKLNGDQLDMRLRVVNTGSEALTFTCALHTYLSIGNIQTAKVQGLKGLEYWDNNGADFSVRCIQSTEGLSFTGPIDRVYFDSKSPLTLVDDSHRLLISTEGFSDVVVWNPGEEVAKNMTDFSDIEHSKMLCIEAANIDRPIVLNPGEQWSGAQVLLDIGE